MLYIFKDDISHCVRDWSGILIGETQYFASILIAESPTAEPERPRLIHNS